MRKYISITIIFIMIVSMLVGCSQRTAPNITEQNVVETPLVEVDIEAFASHITQWQDPDTKMYSHTFLVYSTDFFDKIVEQDILYLEDGEYVNFEDVFRDAKINLINTNDQTGVCAYIQLSTHTMIDLSKLFFVVDGPTNPEYGFDKEECIEKHGKSSWNTVYLGVTTKSPYYNVVSELQTDKNHIVFQVDSGDMAYTYIHFSPKGTKIEENDRVFSEYTFDVLGPGTIERFVEQHKNQLVFVEETIKDDGSISYQTKSGQQSSPLIPYMEMENNVIRIGVKTKNGESINQYKQEMPDALSLQSITTLSFFDEI